MGQARIDKETCFNELEIISLAVFWAVFFFSVFSGFDLASYYLNIPFTVSASPEPQVTFLGLTTRHPIHCFSTQTPDPIPQAPTTSTSHSCELRTRRNPLCDTILRLRCRRNRHREARVLFSYFLPSGTLFTARRA